ncbi:MAG: DUF4738 domain-containing protein [Prevotella sp.]|nr:DUF4738 domain-containing protein [Prevotella sp.]
MKTNRFKVFMVCCLVLTLMACSEKKKSDDIITERVEQPKPQEPVRLQSYSDSKEVGWIGRTYRIAIDRHPSDSLPMVSDETGQKFVDNVIALVVSREDGSVFYRHQFTKKDFNSYLDDDYRKTGILEGLVYDKVEGDWLEFAASVCHPQTDEYIPLIVRLSRMGQITIQRDTQMDTTGETPQQEPSSEEEQD